MTKGNIENSLKRFLKRKIKFTLGLMITFLITGAFAFAEETIKKPESMTKEEYYKHTKYDGTFIAEEFLTGLGTGKISIGETTENSTTDWAKENIQIDNTDGTKTIIKYKDTATGAMAAAVEIDNSLISTKTADILSETLKNMNEKTEVTGSINVDGTIISNITINKGIKTQSQSSSGKTISNNGIIKFKGNNGQHIQLSVNAYNFGIIANSGQQGQYGVDNQNVNAYNYGIIANGGNLGQKVEKGTITNYGIIANGGENGQNINVGDAYNYGIIANGGNTGQILAKGNLINYGIIKNKGDMGQWLYGTGTIYNYGIIANTGGYGQRVDNGETKAKAAYNYGLIANDGDYAIVANSKLDNNKAVNYGVVINKTGNVFKDKVDNYGIVILTNEEKQTILDLGTGTNNGIILGHDYNLLEGYKDDTKVFKSGETIKDFGGENSFEDKTKGYVLNESVNIDNVQNKTIGAVVTKDSGLTKEEAVFKYDGKDPVKDNLLIDNSYLVGYFEKDGTLLDVGNGSLTLKGDTNITAVKGDLSLDVTAVKLGENGELFIMDDAKINGKIEGGTGTIKFIEAKGIYDVDGGNVYIGIKDKGDSKYQNSFNITLTSSTQDKDGQTSGNINNIQLDTKFAAEGLVNKLTIDNSVTVGTNDKGYSIYDTNDGSDEDHNNTNAELEISIGSIHNIKGNVALGVGKDTFKIENHDYCTIEDENHKNKTIDLGAGEDRFIAVGEAEKNVFAYNVKNAETIELQNGIWTSWDDAGTISFDNVAKENIKPNFVLGKDTTIEITFNDKGSDFERHIEKLTANGDLGIDHAVIQGTDETSVVRYRIDETTGLDMNNLSSNKYSFDDKINFENQSSIFNIENKKEEGITITIKSAEDFGFSSQERIIYEAYLEKIKADGNIDEDAQKVIAQINKLDFQGFKEQIQRTKVSGEAYYTAGSVLAKDITNTYVSAVQDFTKRAEKGQWLAQGKYLNSDTEFNGGKEVRGYDGDITGTVGMIEYGVTENTSYGAVFGKGNTKMDIDGGGKLDGDNTYAGLYAKHRTGNGIEFTADIGYMENNMESLLRNDFNFSNKTDTDGVSSSGKTFEKGTADSSSVSFGVKGRKDYKISDTVKLQPVLGARLTFINQEEAENPEMFFTIEKQDIMVFEGTAGMGIVKEIALSHGAVQLNAGAEYTFAASSSTNDAEYTLFKDTEEKPLTNPIEDTKAAENTGKLFVGADYEHENGVGFNGKYEMLWSDKGDDSRITAGMSYRF